MRIGVIADTHGHLDPRVRELFAGVGHILHAGDVGGPQVIDQLTALAPVTVVAGNNDLGGEWPERAEVKLAGWKFLVQHIVDPLAPNPAVELTVGAGPCVIVFGHTHRAHAAWRGERFYFNPGYAGRPRFKLARSVAVLEVTADGVRHEFIAL